MHELATAMGEARLTRDPVGDPLPLVHLDRRGEDIAAATHRLDHRRSSRLVIQLVPEPPNLNVDRPVIRPGLLIAGEIEQPVAGQHLIGVLNDRPVPCACVPGAWLSGRLPPLPSARSDRRPSSAARP
jgi:hypothetical protein